MLCRWRDRIGTLRNNYTATIDAGQIDGAPRAHVSPETMTSVTRQALRVHPDTVCAAVTQIEVDVARPRAGSLILTYAVTGKIGELAMPPIADPVRTDELWQHTCFEAFLRGSVGAGYFEFNFAPSTQWAAYRFQQLPDREMRCDRDQYPLDCSGRWSRALPFASVAGIGSVGTSLHEQARGRDVAARSFGDYRRDGWPSVLLGAGSSTRQAGFSSSRLLCS